MIQPNFDVVAYLEQADARTAGILGRIAESDSAHSGPIQTFRLTQASVYQAEESGLSHTQIVDFLRRHGQPEPPANVLRSLEDWSGKRESLSLRSGLTILGFATAEERDAYLAGHRGTACGDRFVIASRMVDQQPKTKLSGYLASDHARRDPAHAGAGRAGLFSHERTDRPRTGGQTATDRSAHGDGLAAHDKLDAPGGRRRFEAGRGPSLAEGHPGEACAPLMAVAIDVWLRVGKDRPLELGDAVLLHVPDQSQFRAIAASPRLRPFLLGSPGHNWLFVNRATRKDLAAALEELGFTLLRELIHHEIPADAEILKPGFPQTKE